MLDTGTTLRGHDFGNGTCSIMLVSVLRRPLPGLRETRHFCVQLQPLGLEGARSVLLLPVGRLCQEEAGPIGICGMRPDVCGDASEGVMVEQPVELGQVYVSDASIAPDDDHVLIVLARRV